VLKVLSTKLKVEEIDRFAEMAEQQGESKSGLVRLQVELLQVLKRRISESNRIVKELARGDKRLKLLRSIPCRICKA
jgi:hypothetical protein